MLLTVEATLHVTGELELAFDTLRTSSENLRRDPRGTDRERRPAAYLAFGGGHERATDPASVHVRVRPTSIRVGDFAVTPPRIEELAPGADA